MKTWKHGIIGILAIITLVFAFIACDDGNGKTDPKTYTVTFNADNGTANTNQTVTEGNKATEPTDPVKDGYTFGYWFNTTTDTEWDFDTAVTANINLKAKWEELPEDQTEKIYFGTDLSTTVKGHMTKTQWNAVIVKMSTALDTAATGDLQVYCNILFEVGLDIILVKTQEYNYYKFVPTDQTLFFNADYAIVATQADLSLKVATAINAVTGSTPMQE